MLPCESRIALLDGNELLHCTIFDETVGCEQYFFVLDLESGLAVLASDLESFLELGTRRCYYLGQV